MEHGRAVNLLRRRNMKPLHSQCTYPAIGHYRRSSLDHHVDGRLSALESGPSDRAAKSDDSDRQRAGLQVTSPAHNHITGGVTKRRFRQLNGHVDLINLPLPPLPSSYLQAFAFAGAQT